MLENYFKIPQLGKNDGYKFFWGEVKKRQKITWRSEKCQKMDQKSVEMSENYLKLINKTII